MSGKRGLLARWLNPDHDPNAIYSEAETLEIMSAYYYSDAHNLPKAHASKTWLSLPKPEQELWRKLTSEKAGYGVAAPEKPLGSSKPTTCLTFPKSRSVSPETE